MAPLLASILMTSTNAYSSTGGNYAGPGATVTQGASYSSVTSQNIDNGANGVTATVQIQTDDNGQLNNQTITKTIPPGGSVDMEVATSSGNAAIGVHTSMVVSNATTADSASGSLKSLQRAVHTLLKTAASTSASTSLAADTDFSVSPNFAPIGFGGQVMLFFQRLFSIFGL
jgi:hypothetical protein